jgi:transposase
VAKARYLVEAHLVEGRWVAELARAHGVHRSWIYKLLARYREGGYEALEPRSRTPRRSPNRTPEELVRAIVSCESSCSRRDTTAARNDRLPPGRAL